MGPKMTNTDLSRLLRSDEIQNAIRAPKKEKSRRILKKNPLKNYRVMMRLNPYAGAQKAAAKAIETRRRKEKQAILDQKRGIATPVDGQGKGRGGRGGGGGRRPPRPRPPRSKPP